MSDPIVLIRNRLADFAAVYSQIIQGASAVSSLQLLKKGESERYHAQIDRGAYRIEATLSTPALAALTVAESVKDLVDAHLRTKGYVMPSFDQAFAALRQACADSAFNPALTADKLSALPKPEPKETPMLKPEPKSAAPVNESADLTPLYKVVPKPKAKKADAATNKDPVVYFEDVTPSLAASYLKHNISTNRTIRKALVDRYAADMKSGHWSPASGSVMFDHLGNLVDGQHRMSAVVQAGITVRMKMESIPEGASLEGIDRGRSRTIGDLLELRGLADKGHGISLAAAAKSLYCLSKGTMSVDNQTTVQKVIECSGDDIAAIFGAGNFKRTSAVFLAPFMYAYPIDKEKVVSLLQLVVANDGLKKNSGGWNLRRLFDAHANHGSESTRFDFSCRVLRCIQAHFEDEKLSNLHGPREGTLYPSIEWARKERTKAGVNQGVAGEKKLLPDTVSR